VVEGSSSKRVTKRAPSLPVTFTLYEERVSMCPRSAPPFRARRKDVFCSMEKESPHRGAGCSSLKLRASHAADDEMARAKRRASIVNPPRRKAIRYSCSLRGAKEHERGHRR